MMVSEIENTMPPDELTEWIAYFDIKHQEEKKQAKLNTAKAKLR